VAKIREDQLIEQDQILIEISATTSKTLISGVYVDLRQATIFEASSR
jgi:hypothetical protein